MINIFTPTACINDEAPAAYQGLERYEARQRILKDLEAAGLLVAAKPHKLMVPRGDRTGAVIEPPPYRPMVCCHVQARARGHAHLCGLGQAIESSLRDRALWRWVDDNICAANTRAAADIGNGHGVRP